MHTIGFTGHRPSKLGVFRGKVYTNLRSIAREYLDRMTPGEVIVGMAVGWDIAVAVEAIALGIPVTAAVPFRGYEKRMSLVEQERFHRVLAQCSRVHYVCPPGYIASKMHHRNRWIVVHSQRLCALWNGSPSGTSNCVHYAQRVGIPIDNLWDEWMSRFTEPTS